MALSNRDRVGKGLEHLQAGAWQFVARELRLVYGTGASAEVKRELMVQPRPDTDEMAELLRDVQVTLKMIAHRWDTAFKNRLSKVTRSRVNELNEVRNDWAHHEPFSTDDAYRHLDTIQLVLDDIGDSPAKAAAKEVNALKVELRQTQEREQSRGVRRRTTVSDTPEGPFGTKLTPWREVITPHQDVSSGNFLVAEFAADLAQVRRGEGAREYRDPHEFFRRTYMTDGLQSLLVNALKRLHSDQPGEPVVKLQTNFGGGKTHAMLALYHLCSGVELTSLPGIEPILRAAGFTREAFNTGFDVNRAVLVGTALTTVGSTKDDGTRVRTLWGEMAWQLLGPRGYALVAEHDAAGINPGTDVLRELFRQADPALILIDEWVAFLRELHGKDGLPAGSFGSNISFVQSLTEAARSVPGTHLVASLPVSEPGATTFDAEAGGAEGEAALRHLEPVFARISSPWRPADTREGFEIVRRRLFDEIPAANMRLRDAVIDEFVRFYNANRNEFPSHVNEAEYRANMTSAYPIHPELFDRLFEDWSQLENFQRTRGVLRLMASVIHRLWADQSASALIMPAMVPINDGVVRTELTRYLSENWQPIIEQDVDGQHALPNEIDREVSALGRFAATTRVARTIYLGSAPLKGMVNAGADDRQIRLGSVQPGEPIATFGDALGRLSNGATYLYSDGGRYRYDTKPTVNKVAQNRAALFQEHQVNEEIVRVLRDELRSRGPFPAIHVAPATSLDVRDEQELRLVVIGPEHPHTGNNGESPARKFAQQVLDSHGNGPRSNRNRVVFVAASENQLKSLKTGMRTWKAWDSIVDESDALNLDATQKRQAQASRENARKAISEQLRDAYGAVLVPSQQLRSTTVDWETQRASGQGSLAERIARPLIISEQVVDGMFHQSVLAHHLNDVPLWPQDGNDIGVKQIWKYFCEYLYLPRLLREEQLLQAIQGGVADMLWATDYFAYASGKSDDGTYQGLVGGEARPVAATATSLIVRPEVAQEQFDAERKKREAALAERGLRESAPAEVSVSSHSAASASVGIETPPPPKEYKRFYGSVEIDPDLVSSQVKKIYDEVLRHMTNQHGSRVALTLEVQAAFAEGVSDELRRTVLENANALKFTSPAFEEE